MTKQIPGQSGGKAVVRKYGTINMRKIGAKGGKAVVKKYGNEYMSVIGTLGADAQYGHLSNWKFNRVSGRRNAILRGR